MSCSTDVYKRQIHVSTLAENRFGIGQIYPNFTYYHIGRGIAVGVVSEGNLIRGAANYAGEYGGYLYDLGGQDGCLLYTSRCV